MTARKPRPVKDPLYGLRSVAIRAITPTYEQLMAMSESDRRAALLATARTLDTDGAHVMEAVKRAGRTRGWPKGRLRVAHTDCPLCGTHHTSQRAEELRALLKQLEQQEAGST